MEEHQRQQPARPTDGARWKAVAEPGRSRDLLRPEPYGQALKTSRVRPSGGWRTGPGGALTPGPQTAPGAPPGAMATSSRTRSQPGACPSPARGRSSERKVSLPALPPRRGPGPTAPPPPKMDSPATRGFERGTVHLERPAGERGPRPPGTRGRRPPTFSRCSLATAQVRAVGALGDAGGGGDKGELGGERWGSFSRVRGPASRHRKPFTDHREEELARETGARSAYEGKG